MKNTVSTGYAAKLCSVTRDSILKWIKKGLIQADRTPGGHYRVLEDSIIPFLATRTLKKNNELGNRGPGNKMHRNGKPSPDDMIPCWEHMSSNGVVAESCQDCLVYRSKALRCFEIASLGERAGFRGTFCETSCNDCEYYKTTQGNRNNNIIAMTEDVYLIASLTRGIHLTPYIIRFTSSAFECSALIENNRPDVIVVDFEMPQVLIENLCERLAEDPRLPGAKIIGVVPKGMNIESLNLCTRSVCASLEKPVSIRNLEICLDTLDEKSTN